MYQGRAGSLSRAPRAYGDLQVSLAARPKRRAHMETRNSVSCGLKVSSQKVNRNLKSAGSKPWLPVDPGGREFLKRKRASLPLAVLSRS